jgi:hypothetical protein
MTQIIPRVFKLPNTKFNDNKNDIVISNSINRPLFKLGFHNYQHRTKSAINITKNLETTKKFYNIVNNFDPENIDINKDKLSTGYFKMWEMMSLFDLANSNKIIYGAIGEGPGSFIQAFIDFRNKYYDLSKDKIYSVTLKSEKDDNVIDMNKKYMGFLKKEYPNLMVPHKTSVKDISCKYTGKDNGDITDLKTIKNFKKDLTKNENKANLITADANKYIYTENYSEQESYILILGEIVAALNVQEKGGDFVLKIFDTFTMLSLKLIYILTSYYSDVYVYKPFTSLDLEEEKYIVCKNFKGIDDKDLNNLSEILEKMNTDKYVNDIYTKLNISENFINTFKYININLVNSQQITINKIVTFIKSNNYYGDEYHTYKDNQENNNNFWLNQFYKDKVYSGNMIKERVKYIESDIKLFEKEFM